MSDRGGEASEIQRLERVYGSYDREQFRRRWDPGRFGNRLIDCERWAQLHDQMESLGMERPPEPLLEVGCGSGAVLARMASSRGFEGRAIGVDVLAERLKNAADRFPDNSWVRADGRELPFTDSSIGSVALFTVLSSILDDGVAHKLSSEVMRVLGPQGVILWYDYRVSRPDNAHTRGISEKAIRELFPGFEPRLVRCTVVPMIARRLGTRTKWVYGLLSKMPMVQTHWCGLLTRRT